VNEDYIRKIDIYEDQIGYVALLSVMGDEFTPAEDARTSTNKGRLGPEKDRKLQLRLLKDNHTSPFEAVLLKFEMVVPLFVLREIDRHRTLTKVSDQPNWDEEFAQTVVCDEGGRKWFARNEMSGRYVQMPNQYYMPKQLRYQDKRNNQGGNFGDARDAFDRELYKAFVERGAAIQVAARELYDWAINNNIEKGQARIFNTQNQYTKIRMTGSLKNWLDFLRLRLPEGVVLHECRMVALAIGEIVSEQFPTVWRDWYENVYDVVTLTQDEKKALDRLLKLVRVHEIDSKLIDTLKELTKKVS
jgi:thymidylate synthase (FAD)